jgi:hypothetical protein
VLHEVARICKREMKAETRNETELYKIEIKSWIDEHTVIMATIFISKALTQTSVEDVRTKFEELELGVIDLIDMKEYDRDGSTFRKFWIHYSSYSKEPHAVQLMARMVQNEKLQKEGGVIPVGDIPRIVYGVNRRGNDMYWQVFVYKTPEQLRIEQEDKLKKPKVRIEYTKST